MNEINLLLDTYKNAVFQKDVEAFCSIFDDNVLIYDMWQWSYNGLLSWRQMAEKWFASLGTEKVLVVFDDIQVHSTDQMASACAYVKFAAVSESGQELRHLYNRLTWVLQKKDGGWKIIHEHTSGPVEHSTLKVIIDR
jgi:uncharacterized protein (TIGR02246 family)